MFRMKLINSLHCFLIKFYSISKQVSSSSLFNARFLKAVNKNLLAHPCLLLLKVDLRCCDVATSPVASDLLVGEPACGSRAPPGFCSTFRNRCTGRHLMKAVWGELRVGQSVVDHSFLWCGFVAQSTPLDSCSPGTAVASQTLKVTRVNAALLEGII